jgi:hypothetical protein
VLVLFDQGTPVGIRDFLAKHTVKTAREQGWSTLLNGDLLREAENAGFEILLTTDKNLIYQQNLAQRKIAIVVLARTRWSLIQSVMARVMSAVDSAQPGSYTVVENKGTSADLSQRLSDGAKRFYAVEPLTSFRD